jgi:hypothetical protein
MTHLRVRSAIRVLLATTMVATLAALAGCDDERKSTIPERLDDSTFWALVSDMSEPGGYFHSDNFVSNELGFQYVIDEMLATVGDSGVYVGVGPDQNFTYVAALRPQIAFIVDIRRQNMLQHLMYKALIEMSSDRADFLARLFSRNWSIVPPAGLEADSLFTMLADLPRDTVQYEANLVTIFDRLTKDHGFLLDSEDSTSLRYVYGAFYSQGVALTYSSNAMRGFSRGMPSYRTLMTATDGDGLNRSYMGSDAAFATLKDLQHRNLIVPITGDFAGPRALRAVGEWLRRHQAKIDVFYVSNVEQYLFQQTDDWRQFYENVATMPRDRHGLFIRSVSNQRRYQLPYSRSTSVMSSIDEVLTMYRSGRLHSHMDVIEISK